MLLDTEEPQCWKQAFANCSLELSNCTKKKGKSIDKEIEEKKEAIRQHSEGKKNKFSISGLGKVLVAAKRTKGLDVDLENLNNLNRKQLAWLINNNVLRLSLNQSGFRSLDKNVQKRILDTECIKRIEYEDGQFRQRVFIKVEEGEETRNTRNLHDSNLPNTQNVTLYRRDGGEKDDDIKEEIDEWWYEDEADLIAKDRDDDIDEYGRSQEEGWPYTDEDHESAEYGRSQEEG